MRSVTSSALRSLLLLLLCGLLAPGPVMAEADVFSGFTAHIRQQVQTDKQTFVMAQNCTEWFYRQLQKKPKKPMIDGISFHPAEIAHHPLDDASKCPLRYPDGLEAARKDFTLNQSSLSVSLTFYEFALVGDRNDDAQYDAVELRDMLEAFTLPFNEALPPSAHLAVLTAQFERIRVTGGLDVLMTGMGILYDRGYRFTVRDRAALNRIVG